MVGKGKSAWGAGSRHCIHKIVGGLFFGFFFNVPVESLEKTKYKGH